MTGAGPVDIMIATLGKALGVNGGYVVAGQTVVDYPRETSNKKPQPGLETGGLCYLEGWDETFETVYSQLFLRHFQAPHLK